MRRAKGPGPRHKVCLAANDVHLRCMMCALHKVGESFFERKVQSAEGRGKPSQRGRLLPLNLCPSGGGEWSDFGVPGGERPGHPQAGAAD